MRILALTCSEVFAIIAAIGYGDDPGRAWFLLAVAFLWALYPIAWRRP